MESNWILYNLSHDHSHSLFLWGTGLAQWWERSPSTNVSRVPGFDSGTRRHKWAEFVFSLLCSERFFSGYSSFPVSPKTNIWFENCKEFRIVELIIARRIWSYSHANLRLISNKKSFYKIKIKLILVIRYGDRAPKSFFARIFCIVWILVGIIIIAIFTAIVTASLSASIQHHFTVHGSVVSPE